MNAAILYHFAAKSCPACTCAYCRKFARSVKGCIKRANNRAARRAADDLSASDGLHIVRGIVQNDVDSIEVAPDLDIYDHHVDLYFIALDAAARTKFDYFDYDSEPLPESYQPVACECGCGKYR